MAKYVIVTIVCTVHHNYYGMCMQYGYINWQVMSHMMAHLGQRLQQLLFR